MEKKTKKKQCKCEKCEELERKIKILSLFDGISIAQQALKNLGVECEYYASEIDKYAIQITQNNFPNTIQLGDCKNR